MELIFKQIENNEEVKQVLEFLYSRASFDMELSEFSKNTRRKSLEDSLTNPHHKFWYALKDNKIIGTIGICENERENGGYWLDYFAVHKDFRRMHIGSKLLSITEQFVSEQSGRYIIIDTSDTELFIPARLFYESQGYTQVSHFPEYYEKENGKIDYYKKI